MPFKKPAQGDNNVQEKIADIERQLKRINTLEVEVKRIPQIEKQIGLMKLDKGRGVSGARTERAELQSLKRSKEIKAELESLRHSMHEENRAEMESLRHSMHEENRAEMESLRRSIRDETRVEVESLQRFLQELASRLYITEQRLAETQQELQTYKIQLGRIADKSRKMGGFKGDDGVFSTGSSQRAERNPDSMDFCSVEGSTGPIDSREPQATDVDSIESNEIQPIIIYQQFQVDKMYVDHFDQENTIRNLGIRELSGKLNIGTTFENGMVPAEFLKEWEETTEKLKKEKEKLQKLNAEEKEKE